MTILTHEPAPDELLCVVGPTASGKTELAIEICEQLGGEVISADSVQIYRHFDLGSGKPTTEQRARAVHHLVDVHDPRDPLDAARFAAMAQDKIAQVRGAGRVPIVCGGTFMWVRAIVYGLARAPAADAQLRQSLRRQALQLGVEALHARLAAVDPATAARLSVRDLVRIERALEVWELTGRTLSELHAEHQAQPPRHNARFLAVRWEREQLDRRIELRAEQWLANGWIDEVARLWEQGFGETRPMGSVGYRQVSDYVQGRLSRDALSLAVIRATRVFARRQRTWLRDVPTTWIDPTGLR